MKDVATTTRILVISMDLQMMILFLKDTVTNRKVTDVMKGVIMKIEETIMVRDAAMKTVDVVMKHSGTMLTILDGIMKTEILIIQEVLMVSKVREQAVVDKTSQP